MNPTDVIINGKIPLKVVKSQDSENILYCKSINEYLFNVCTFSTREKDLILEFTDELNEKYVTLDIQEGENLYSSIKFKVVLVEGEIPYSIFNPSFTKPTVVPVALTYTPPEFLLNPVINEKEETRTEEKVDIVENVEIEYVPLRSGQYYEVAINGKVPMTMLESDQAENILFCSSFQDHLFNVGIFSTRNSELILEYTQENNKKYAYADLLFENGDYYNKVKFKVVMVEDNDVPFSTFNLKTLDQKTKTYVEFTGPTEIIVEKSKADNNPILENITQEDRQQVVKLKDEYDQAIKKAKLLEQQLEEEKLIIEQQKKSFEKKKAIVESAKQIETAVWSNILEKLDTFKKNLHENFKQTSKKDLDEYIINKLKDDIETSIKLDEKIEEIITQHQKISLIKEDFQRYVDRSVQNALKEAKKFAGLIAESGGGGSVALQLANGGTINGDLNVNGQYLSGGINILDIITNQGGIQTLAYNEPNYLLTISQGNTVSLSSINTTFAQNSSNFASTYSTLKETSASFVSVYTSFNENSSSYTTYSDVESKYLKLSGGTITGNLNVNNNLTVYGNLTALGDSYFVNTVFTTTSAVSVINVGRGPALYVYQGPGPYDVASFYDGDGVEVLHVGNAQPGGKGFVGVNESYPGAELTVNGVISSNNIVIALNGNSNLWNSNYSTTQNNSGNWHSTYVNVYNLSGNWESVYNSWYNLSSMYVTTHYLSTNNVKLSAATVADDINVGGTGYFNHVAATSKSFYIKHPTYPDRHLQYGSLESPYHGIRLTGKGTIKTECRVELPHYIRDLVTDSDVNIQLTNLNHDKVLFVSTINVAENHFIIKRKNNIFNKNKTYEFFWTFTAIRKDIPELQPEI